MYEAVDVEGTGLVAVVRDRVRTARTFRHSGGTRRVRPRVSSYEPGQAHLDKPVKYREPAADPASCFIQAGCVVWDYYF